MTENQVTQSEDWQIHPKEYQPDSSQPINQITASRHKTIYLLGALLIFALFVNAMLIWCSPVKKNNSKNETSLSTSSAQIEISPTPLGQIDLEFQKVDNLFWKEIFTELPPDVINRMNSNRSDLDCIDFKGTDDYRNFSTLAASIQDEKLIGAMQKIEDKAILERQIEEEVREDGTRYSRTIEANVLYRSVCKDETKYYVLFTINRNVSWQQISKLLIPEAYAAGGVGDVYSLMVVDQNGETYIWENPIASPESIKIYDPDLDTERFPNGYAESSKMGIPYYSCNHIASVNDQNVYLACGGGDGPGSGSSLYEVNLSTKKIKEVAFCTNLVPQKNNFTIESCFDEMGNIYFKKNLGN
ncbi:MAG TPA: hypothetical protein PKX78_02370 [Candidatus Woesebacteria bacterium]|nr:hypothetical protein [Candidatus Woesebacteria bacterium]